MTYKVHALFIAVFITFSTGCTQRFADTNETLKEAFWGFEDVSLNKEAIEKIPYASSYFKINGGPQIFMVLAFVEKNPQSGKTQHKWLSSDKAMIVTEEGRIVRTYNLPEANLAGKISPDSLIHFNTPQYHWTSLYDWQPEYQYNHQAKVTTVSAATIQLNSVMWSQKVKIWQEYISFEKLDETMQSTFWVDSNGNVLKSAQWVIPGQLFIEQEILKPFKG
ncbi:YjbF family lipoprotein [Vibrio coralliilyticus]|uniref:YjbF family lipoprotein n=1 Tax=Vibrio coralliilyticus TaxID=190893 RepID=UPI001560C6E4|nr:YjbF family lipoprotein [Vibrio coralliilyticus]NRF31329.1 YjbF family lipoprotein [Vibrio coralliilyticus]NRF54763.1 YjbF family lipoprotein [Vibrio coralliilyticus]NRG01913.1 YjbF family lipoprotein [Vibrio coralliilyticus]